MRDPLVSIAHLQYWVSGFAVALVLADRLFLRSLFKRVEARTVERTREDSAKVAVNSKTATPVKSEISHGSTTEEYETVLR
jgi:hypothetical protein